MLSLIHWNPFLHLCQKLVEYICVALSLSSLLQSINLCVYPTISTMVSRLQFNSVQSLSCVQLFVTSWIAACQASLSINNSRSSLKLMPIESVMPSSHLMPCRSLLLLPPIPPSIRVFSNESTLCMRWPKYWSFSFSITPSNEYSGLISLRIDWFARLNQGGKRCVP